MLSTTTIWLWLLLLVVASHQIVDSQSTTNDETCSEEPMCRSMVERLLFDQQQLRQQVQQLFQQHCFGPEGCGLVDECKFNNGECSQVCVDTYDSYYCTCRDGYQLAQNIYTCPEAIPCDSVKIDLVFLVDSSRSLCGSDQQCSEWQDILDFVNSVINQLNVGKDHTRIGFVRYSSTSATSNEFYLNSNQFDRNQVMNAVSSVHYHTGRSIVGELANAFQVARTQQFVSNRGYRFDAENVIVALLNGGGSAYSPAMERELEALRQAGISVFSVAIGTRAQEIDVQHISSVPQLANVNYFLSPSINNLNRLSGQLAAQICQSSDFDCDIKAVDLVFVVSASSSVGWSNVVSFVSSIASVLNVQDGLARVGLVTFGDTVHHEFYLNTYHDRTQLLTTINSTSYRMAGSGRNVKAALSETLNRQFNVRPTQSQPSNVTRIALLITDVKTSQSEISTLEEAKVLHLAGINIFTIGVSSLVNVTELQLISSSPRLQNHQWWTVSNFPSLSTIQYFVTRSVCRREYGVQCRFTETGGYQCFCLWGMCDTRPMNGTTCEDVDECEYYNGGCQQTCDNSIGSYSCRCEVGFTLAPDGLLCSDINECADPSTCQTGHCVNSNGGYYCLTLDTIIPTGLKGEDPSLTATTLTGGYASVTVALAVALGATVALLVVIFVALVVRHIRSSRLKYAVTANTDTPVSRSPGIRKVPLPSWGFASIRSKFSVTSEDSVDTNLS